MKIPVAMTGPETIPARIGTNIASGVRMAHAISKTQNIRASSCSHACGILIRLRSVISEYGRKIESASRAERTAGGNRIP